MSILSKYLLLKYLKLFFIILLSLELFFVSFEFIQNIDSIPESANLAALYIFYNSFFTLTIALPLSLVFAWILLLVVMIRNNELVSIYSLGASKRKLFIPILIVNFIALSTLIVLQTTPLAYAYEKKKQILDGEYFSSLKEDIFVKYDDVYIYFKKLYPLEQRAEGIEIFEVVDRDLIKTISSPKAFFKNDRWYVIDANITYKPQNLNFLDSKLEFEFEKFIYTLDGFKPKILDNVYTTNANYSIIDAVDAWIILTKQGVNTQGIRAIIYNQMLVPLFVLPLIFLFYIFISLNNRFFESRIFASFTIFSTLLIWGGFFLLYKFAIGSVLLPEVALIAPLVLLTFIVLIVYNKKIIPS
ncbi:MAG: LptF/LptG family permease [Arcobacteraceae bacterium]|nr:LptF/LptG family permease [Arcobacteraceae bacterium]